MKIVMVSDIHLGVKNNSQKFLSNTRDFFDNQVCDVIEKTKAEYLMILGDLFDNMILVDILVKNTSIDIINNILNKFPHIQIKLLAGNHDLYYKNTTEVTSLAMFKKFDARVEVITNIKPIKFGNDCIGVMVPWLIKESRNEKIFNKIVDEYKDTNKIKYDVCFGHFHINGFEIVRGVYEQKGHKQEDFKAFGSVFTGHFHIRNKIQNIQYLGCPYEITWNDYGDKKGITVFDTVTKTSEFYENTISPRHLHINISDLKEHPEILDSVNGNIVKFHVDTVIDESDKLKYINIIQDKSLDYTQIDETIKCLDDNDVEISDVDVSTSVLGSLFTYCDELNNIDTEQIDIDELKIYLDSIYQECIRDGKS